MPKILCTAIFLSLALSGCVVLIPLLPEEDEAGFHIEAAEEETYSFPLEPSGLSMESHSNTVPRRVSAPSKRDRLVQSLIAQLGNREAVVRTHAASQLGEIGRPAESAISALARVLKYDRNKWARRAAAKSLGKIGSPRAIPPLQEALKDSNKWVAHSASQALKLIKPLRGNDIVW